MPPSHLAPSAPPPSGRHLSFAEREEIALLRARGHGVREIGRRTGRAGSTISRELRRTASTRGGSLEYRATTAQWHSERAARRPKAKLATNDALRHTVEDRLAGRIVHPDGTLLDGPRTVWREAPPRPAAGAAVGAGLEPRADLGQAPTRLPRGRDDAHLPRGDPSVPLRPGSRGAAARADRLPADGAGAPRPRVPASAGRGKSFVAPEVMISARPAEVEDRAVPGHWEGDLILGLRRSASGHAGGADHAPHDPAPPAARRGPGGGAGTDRHRRARGGDGAWRRGRSRRHRRRDHDAARAAAPLAHLGVSHRVAMRSRPMANAPRWRAMPSCASRTACRSTSATPTAPGSAAPTRTTGGLLRQHFPKGTDLARHGQGELEAVAAALNGRPRKTLGWRTPAEALDEVLRSAQTDPVATTG